MKKLAPGGDFSVCYAAVELCPKGNRLGRYQCLKVIKKIEMKERPFQLLWAESRAFLRIVAQRGKRADHLHGMPFVMEADAFLEDDDSFYFVMVSGFLTNLFFLNSIFFVIGILEVRLAACSTGMETFQASDICETVVSTNGVSFPNLPVFMTMLTSHNLGTRSLLPSQGRYHPPRLETRERPRGLEGKRSHYGFRLKLGFTRGQKPGTWEIGEHTSELQSPA